MINLKIKKKKDYQWALGFVLGKLLWLYYKMDPGNFEKNKQNLEDELNIELGNRKNEKPNTSNIQ